MLRSQLAMMALSGIGAIIGPMVASRTRERETSRTHLTAVISEPDVSEFMQYESQPQLKQAGFAVGQMQPAVQPVAQAASQPEPQAAPQPEQAPAPQKPFASAAPGYAAQSYTPPDGPPPTSGAGFQDDGDALKRRLDAVENRVAAVEAAQKLCRCINPQAAAPAVQAAVQTAQRMWVAPGTTPTQIVEELRRLGYNAYPPASVPMQPQYPTPQPQAIAADQTVYYYSDGHGQLPQVQQVEMPFYQTSRQTSRTSTCRRVGNRIVCGN